MVQKKSNVLDKPVSHHKSSTSGPAGVVGTAGGGVAPDIDVKKLTVNLQIFAYKHLPTKFLEKFCMFFREMKSFGLEFLLYTSLALIYGTNEIEKHHS